MHQATSDYAQTHFNKILERASHNSEGVMIIQEDKVVFIIRARTHYGE